MENATEIPLFLCYPSAKARPIDPVAVKALKISIEDCGLMTPITVRKTQRSRDGQMTDAFEVIAGMHRVKACHQVGRTTIPAFVIEADDLHAELMLIDENLCRSDLSPAERASATSRRKAIFEQLHPEAKAGAVRARSANEAMGHDVGDMLSPTFTEETANSTGQHRRTIQRDASRGEALGEDVLAKVARTSLDKGAELDALAKMKPAARDALVDRAANGENVSAKIQAKKDTREQREAALGATQCAMPLRKYGVIVADPEWRFEPWSRDTGMDRAADNHYPTSCTEVIASRGVPLIAAQDCVLWLWATVPMLPHALLVMAAWGFDYRSNYVWAKDRAGTGYWNRNKHEQLLIGVRGNVPAPAPGTQLDSLIQAAVNAHSAKPECFLKMIEDYFPSLPKIELNRSGPPREGWDAWGYEAQTTDGTMTAQAEAETSVYRETETIDPITREITEREPAESSA